MNATPPHTPFHPRWYRRRVSTYWWLARRAYVTFILREISSIFVAWFVVYLLLFVRAVSDGAVAYGEFLAWSGSPPLLLLNGVSLVFIVFHAITWFNLAPQAMVIHVAGRRVPGPVIAGSNYAAWIVTSAIVAWLLVRGGV